MKSPLRIALAFGSALLPALALGATPANSPYALDAQHSHVEDATSHSIGTVNMIMCIMNAMRPAALVNKGDYLALVDQAKCDSNSASGNSNSGATGGSGQAPVYMNATVNSSRASNADPMRVRVWLDDSDENGKRLIYVNTSATTAPDATNPYGVFRLDFCGRGDPAQPCMMQGNLEGKADGSLTFFQTESRGNQSQMTQLALTPNGTDRGSGSIQDTANGASAGFTFAYDPNLYLRSDGNAQQCFSRDAGDPGTGVSVWRYGLYDAATGERVERNSGFPIEFTVSAVTYRGYLSYWGLSLPPDAAAALTDNATVTKVDFGSGSAPTRTDYTVVKSAGKLTKYTRRTRTLQSLDQIRFNVFIGQEAANLFTGAMPNTNYEMYWDDAGGVFHVSGVMNCANNGCTTHSFDAGQEKTVGIMFWQNQSGIQGWSSSLGGELFIDLKGVTDPVASQSVVVSYRVQDLVYPSDFPASLYCVRDCPTAASIGDFFAPGSMAVSPFTAVTFNNWSPTQPADVVSYSPSTTAGVLIDAAGQSIVFTDASALGSHPQYQQGMRTGRLIANLADAECAPGAGQYCDFQVQNVDVYYVWETGSNPWNQFAAVKDAAGTFVKFDAPLQVNYVVPAGSEYGVYAGKTLVLQYGGFGQLWGIPGECVSRDTNATVSCDTQNSRYVAAFAIPYDATLGVASAGSTSYLVKWLEREIRFAAKDVSVCAQANLALPASVTLPTAAGLKDPSDPNSDIYIGAVPVVTDPVRVIQGDIKW